MKNSSDSPDLFERIGSGDVEALAEYLMGLRSHILRRIQGKLRKAGMTLIDAEDIFGSAGRRLLVVCREGRLSDKWVHNLEHYIFTLALNVAREKIRAERGRLRTIRRLWNEQAALRARNGHDPLARILSRRIPDQKMIERAIAGLNPCDQELMRLKLQGLSVEQIAPRLGVRLDVLYQRWRRCLCKISESRHSPQDANRAA